MKKLLALLKLVPSLSTILPHDARTLLQTTKQTDIQAVFPGEYYHFGLISSIQDFCNRIENLTIDEIAIAINIDGVPLFNSSTAALWPILGNIIPYKKVFMIGVYYGHQKPQDANIYLARPICPRGSIVVRKWHYYWGKTVQIFDSIYYLRCSCKIVYFVRKRFFRI